VRHRLISLAARRSALRYQSCFTSYILADDKPVATLTTRYFDSVKVTEGHQGVGVGTAIPLGRLGFLGLGFNTSTSNSAVATETIAMTLDAEAVAQLGRASRIEFKTCNDTMVASPAFVQAAHELACKVAQLSSGATPIPAPLIGSPAPVPVRVEIAGKRFESEQGPAFAWVLTIHNTSPGPVAATAADVVQLNSGGSSEFVPLLTYLPDGTLVAVWTDIAGRDGHGYGVFGRSFAADGTPFGPDFRVNLVAAGNQTAADLAATPDGDAIALFVRGIYGERLPIVARILRQP
jgi:hypothetical protein